MDKMILVRGRRQIGGQTKGKKDKRGREEEGRGKVCPTSNIH
jgi:hypothetical protein